LTSAQLHSTLTSGRLSKKQVTVLVEELTNYPELVGTLLEAIWIEDSNNSFNASWTFDHLMRKKLDYILPFIKEFTNGLENLNSESCIRSIAHVCELIVLRRYKKKDSCYQENITKNSLELIVSACFDWLIGSKKVAAKVFAMTSLLYLGTEFKWIHPELRPILENTIHSGTVGYKYRAKKTLEIMRIMNNRCN